MRVNLQKLLGYFAVFVVFNLLTSTFTPAIVMASELPTSYPEEEQPQRDPVRLDILSDSLINDEGLTCGIPDENFSKGLYVTIQNWYADYILEGRSFTGGNPFSSWSDLTELPDSQLTVNNTNATFFLSLQTQIPAGAAGWEFRVLDSEGLVVSNIATINYTVVTDPDAEICGGVEIPEEPEPEDTYTIFGTKFEDLNNNSLPDAEDAKVEGTEIRLYTLEEDSWVYVWKEVSASDGTYSFSELSQGTYFLCEVNQEGWMQVYPNAENAGVQNNSGEDDESSYCLQIVIDNESETNIVSKDFVNRRVPVQSGTIYVFKYLLDQNGEETDSPQTFGIDLYSEGVRLDIPTQLISDNGDNSLLVAYEVSVGNYEVKELETPGYANLGCKEVESGATTVTVEEDSEVYVACINWEVDYTPQVNIVISPSSNVTEPESILLNAIASSGNGSLSYAWSCSNGQTSNTSTITLSAVGTHECFVIVTDEDGDMASASGLYTISRRPVVIKPSESASSGVGQGNTNTSSNSNGDVAEGINTTDEGNEEEVLGTESQVCEVKSPVSGYVFIDNNRNNSKDNNEEGISNVSLSLTVTAFDENGVAQKAEVQSVSANTLGRWETTLCPGTYNIKINLSDLSEGLSLGGEDNFNFTVERDQSKENVNFAVYSPSTTGSTNWWLFLIPLVLLVLAAGGYAIFSTNQRRKSGE